MLTSILVCIILWLAIHSDEKSKVGANTVDIVDKKTTLTEKHITTASCVVLIVGTLPPY